MLADDFGNWVPTGVACMWPRCVRCRRPTQHKFGTGMCTTCYYYHALPKGTFWEHKNDFFFPYNIGERVIKGVGLVSQ